MGSRSPAQNMGSSTQPSISFLLFLLTVFLLPHSSSPGKTGLLVAGGEGAMRSAEVWTAEASCQLPDLTRDLVGATLGMVDNSTVALCQEEGNKGSTTRGEQQDSETHTVIATNIQLESKLAHKELAHLIHSRHAHACGTYHLGETQMLIVTGGYHVGHKLKSTEVLNYSDGEKASWRCWDGMLSQRHGMKPDVSHLPESITL